VSGSGISWAICKSASRSRQITTPAPTTHFFQAGCPSCRPTNSVKALKVTNCWIFVERDRYARLCSDDHIDVINVWNVYLKFLINAFVIFVNVYYVNKRHMKCRKLFEAVNNISGVNSAYCCTNWNFEFPRSAKCLQTVRKNANVYCQRLLTFVIFFIINAFIDVYYYFWTFNTSMDDDALSLGRLSVW